MAFLDPVTRLIWGGMLATGGHWGVPCSVFEDVLFFGQDRMDSLNWRLDQAQNC